MHTDVNTAAQIAHHAAEFAWTWSVADLTTFGSAIGLHLNRLTRNSATFTTNHSNGRTDADAYITTDGTPELQRISYFTTDITDPTNAASLVGAYTELSYRITSDLGAPTRREAQPNSYMRWDLPNVILILTASNLSIDIDILNPNYRTWLHNLDLDTFRPETEVP
ncbi:hypothetical protein GCM10027167_78020 [Nocardia heshunensis]